MRPTLLRPVALLLLWSCWVHGAAEERTKPPKNSTAIVVPAGYSRREFNNSHVVCQDSIRQSIDEPVGACYSSSFVQSTVECGENACKYTDFKNSTVSCSGLKSCGYGSFKNSTVSCSGLNSCGYASLNSGHPEVKFTNATVFCNGEWSCIRAHFSNSAVSCNGEWSCSGAHFKNSTVSCSGLNSCGYGVRYGTAIHFSHSTVSCNGDWSCNQAGFKNSTVSCNGTVSCFHSIFLDSAFQCQGRSSCKKADPRNSQVMSDQRFGFVGVVVLVVISVVGLRCAYASLQRFWNGPKSREGQSTVVHRQDVNKKATFFHNVIFGTLFGVDLLLLVL